MVGYPHAANWVTYYALNYKQMIHEKRNPPLTKEQVAEQYGTQFHEYV
jgi:hypothetical protein